MAEGKNQRKASSLTVWLWAGVTQSTYTWLNHSKVTSVWCDFLLGSSVFQECGNANAG